MAFAWSSPMSKLENGQALDFTVLVLYFRVEVLVVSLERMVAVGSSTIEPVSE